uniref:Fe2OG dioxygenase domain-containing protein n=1 Tax=Mycena chlorophos TaxID=658473 RepID=A0ABQ0MBB2_MYCCL|nr:predicted protein [Mycena chlorophos]
MLFGDEIPRLLRDLLSILSPLLRHSLPNAIHTLLFPAIPRMARQAIVNLYHPGEGITPHVDLLGRYADGIVGVSFGSGCVMRFDRTDSDDTDDPPRHLFLPERSVIVLCGDARYKWLHGIERRTEDVVVGPDGSLVSIARTRRVSVTFRWLLPGADVVGDSDA